MIFESGYELSEFKKYYRRLRKDTIKDIVKDMDSEYTSCDSEKEKKLIEYRLKDIISDIDKAALLSIPTGVIIPMIASVITYSSDPMINMMIKLPILVALYGILTVYIYKSLKYNRVCRLYLEVIQTIKDKEKEDKKVKKDITMKERDILIETKINCIAEYMEVLFETHQKIIEIRPYEDTGINDETVKLKLTQLLTRSNSRLKLSIQCVNNDKIKDKNEEILNELANVINNIGSEKFSLVNISTLLNNQKQLVLLIYKELAESRFIV